MTAQVAQVAQVIVLSYHNLLKALIKAYVHAGASTLSTGALIGVIAGSMVGVALVCGIAAGAVLSRRKKHSAATDAPMFQ